MFQNERNTISVADLSLRTTSQVEALNSTVQRTFPNSPTIFTFVQNLRLFDSIKSTDLHQLHSNTMANQPKKKKRLEDQQRDDKIDICSDSLRKEEIGVFEFLRIMADKNIVVLSDGMKVILSTHKKNGR